MNRICSPGPQVITGMRGCGKTMLLRALQLHARAARRDGEGSEVVVHRLHDDNYVGLFVSAQRLLDRLGHTPPTVGDPFARLFVAYGLEAVRAIHHLRDIDDNCVSKLAYKDLGNSISRCVTNSEDVASATSGHDLDNRINRLLLSMSRGDEDHSLAVHPNTAFPTLARAIRGCSVVWGNAQILFLLDDVSTRYLREDQIEELLSSLMFQDETCAFKLTSEAQTIEPGLKSPAKIHPARVGRDLSVFDLGAAVYEKVKNPEKGNGRHFVEDILTQRGRYFASHPEAFPSELLGDASLETIASEIGFSPSRSKKRKQIYRGITALARMCVGDIGDVISLYEQILKKGAGKPYPISPKVQSECFQDFCARRLYDLNRRVGQLKHVAQSFSEAAHELLVASCSGRRVAGKGLRIRQYASLYVRITSGDTDRQTARLRELVDAGVFVFGGGSNVPRTKTRDSNPMQQFKLTYRKIYGLVNFIGLAERDRFELSGTDLENWLFDPAKRKQVLLRNVDVDEHQADEELDASIAEEEIDSEGEQERAAPVTDKDHGEQILLFGSTGTVLAAVNEREVSAGNSIKGSLTRNVPIIEEIDDRKLAEAGIDWVVVGLGFEERTSESITRLCAIASPENALLVSYQQAGRRQTIEATLASKGISCREKDYGSVIVEGLPLIDGNVVVDVTGLAKPAIFEAVRNELRKKRRVWVCHTEAEAYYPLEADLARVFSDPNSQVVLERLHDILTGEDGPYECVRLLAHDADDTRQRVLCAFSSPKHQRLLSLLDERQYERMELIAPTGGSYRDKVARIAAELAAQDNINSDIAEMDSNDVNGTLSFLTSQYTRWCLDRGLNFELGLTGSKLQTVVCATVSAALRVAQCWYVRPREFDAERFTDGVGATRLFSITLKEAEWGG